MMMNKYQEALKNVKEVAKWQQNTYVCYGYICDQDILALEELVEKATPKKPLGLSLTHDGRVGNCPFCKKLVRERSKNICECGQKLDWSDEE